MSMPLSRPGLSLLNRRGFLSHAAMGLGGVALTHLLSQDRSLAVADPIRPVIDPRAPYQPRLPHHGAS